MKMRLARPRYLIDLNRLPDLSEIKEEDNSIYCGAMSRHVQLEESELFRKKLPMVCEAASHIGDAQVRNRGTLGGALAEADPAGDWGPVVLALNARLRCVGLEGERWVEAKDFFTFAYTTVLRDDEILTDVLFPIPPLGSKGIYLKLERVTGDFAIASVALQMAVDRGGVCRSIGIGLGGVGTTPVKAEAVERLISGKTLSQKLIDQAAQLVSTEVAPLSDLRGSEEYKKKVVGTLLTRALHSSMVGA
jgi:carbon-monoxide dehydrogenase medium subunit